MGTGFVIDAVHCVHHILQYLWRGKTLRSIFLKKNESYNVSKPVDAGGK